MSLHGGNVWMDLDTADSSMQTERILLIIYKRSLSEETDKEK